ncbi:MAG: imidazole glycerol phosphate synthase subunit HisH [Elusimicrobiota bacterium]|nr:imidazole glycerol phosphate synthase subunit HisH [Endomicrobiia bacterium]MCX7641014.1 imidazole glycerol phosphate synthase subunit HisH [Elusimicrobiales bacterium]MDW8165540.1 imidazole glycerol phosphate synthase subunit HisH [Elusimicrobiota bacterium]
MIKKVGIINYGVGNLMSITKAIEFLGLYPKIITKKVQADMIILPGVGSFGYAINYMKKTGLYEEIINFINSGNPVLGICLGLQILFKNSEEEPTVSGLGVLDGKVVKFEGKKLPVPHMCWNLVEFKNKNHILLEGLNKKEFFYFVHSYYPIPKDKSIIFGETFYFEKFCSMILKDNIVATQFHLEKSGEIGLKLLKNIVNYFNRN